MPLSIGIATAALAALTLLPLSRSDAWWVRSLDFPRLQLSVLALVLLVVDLLVLDLSRWPSMAAIGVCAGCLAYQAWWILPYTRFFPVEVEPASVAPDGDHRPSLRVMVSNVLTSNRRSDLLLRLVEQHRPDVLVTLETDRWWQERLDTLEPDFPHAIKCPRDNLYGMHVYSRLPLEQATVDYLVEPDIPSMHALIVLRSGRTIRAHFLHPTPPAPPENESSSPRDAELLIVGDSVAGCSEPVIVTGDLNDVAWSATTRLFRKISGLLDPRVGRGMFNTFHAKHWYLRWPLDHLFHSRHFTVREVRRLPPIGSDHFPLLAELVLSPAQGARQRGLEADADDAAEAREKTSREGVDAGDVPQPSGRRSPLPQAPGQRTVRGRPA